MLVIDRVSHHFDRQAVLEDVSLECASGKITCLIGPSGCGKTTLLRLTAGLLNLQSGEIRLDDEILASESSARPPEQRPIGMVFQEGALFPHMTVADNVAFGLNTVNRKQQAMEWLERVGLSELAGRFPDSLSGGQRQRVALARALATEPRALLFDEPYANLDVQRRRSLREDARRMIRESGAIGLFVTHDPDEVLAIADHVVAMDKGLVVENGTPQDLYDAPSSNYVAQLFGEPQSLDAVLDDHGLTSTFGTWERSCLTDPDLRNGPVHVVVHADQLNLDTAADGPRVVEVRPMGRRNRVVLTTEQADRTLFVDCARQQEQVFEVGAHVRVTPNPGSVYATHNSHLANENDSH